ncbi:Ser-Thr-rich GPI-anchored membrane family protein [Bacteroidota bacterium]
MYFLERIGLYKTLLIVSMVCFVYINNNIIGQSAYSDFYFDNGSTGGWKVEGPYDEYGLGPYSASFTDLMWADLTNYPNQLYYDVQGDSKGSLWIACGEGHGIRNPEGSFWIMQFVSPNLSGSELWQNARGYTVQVAQDIGIDAAPIYTNLFVKVYDFDMDTTRYFYNGTAQPVTNNQWNQYTFNWTTLENFPTNYRLEDIHVNIWGRMDSYYSGNVFIDDVVLIPGLNITVDFSVDTRYVYPLISGQDVVEIRGSIPPLNWDQGIAMEDPESDNLYEVTIEFDPAYLGSQLEYKFAINRGDGSTDWEDQIQNRLFELTSPGHHTLPVIYFNDYIPEVFRPTLLSPGSGSYFGDETIILEWRGIETANAYIVQIDDDLNFSSPIVDLDSFTNQFIFTLPFEDTFYWRVNAQYGSVFSDWSDVWSVVRTSIIITQPNESTIWEVGSIQDIVWQDIINENVKIELFNQDAFYSNIVTSTPSDGNHSWTVPTDIILNDAYSVKITSIVNSQIFGYSDQFAIAELPFISVIAPDSNSFWYMGINYNLIWEDNIAEEVQIDLYKDRTHILNITQSTPSSGEYLWSIPSDLEPGTDYQIKIQSTLDSQINDFSDSFTLQQFPFIEITAPTFGVVWPLNTTQTITWEDNIDEEVDIDLYQGENFIMNIALSTPSDGEYSWQVPGSLVPGAEYQIRIISVIDLEIFDFSDSFVVDEIPVIGITDPPAGAVWYIGTEYNIVWDDNIPEEVTIDLYKGSSEVLNIVVSTPSDGVFPWTVPAGLEPDTDYRIKIYSTIDPSVENFSDYFTIALHSFINVLIPSSDTTWDIGTTQTIFWEDNIDENVHIDLTKNRQFLSIIVESTESDGSFEWTISTNLVTGSDYRILISSIEDASINDISDDFTLTLDKYIVINQPNSESILEAGTSSNITWEDNFAEDVIIDFYKGENFVENIVTSTSSDGIFTWVIPEDVTSGQDYRIKITSTIDESVYAFSNQFRIVVPPVADFEASPTFGIRPLEVQFYDLSTGDITGWTWDFGDGNQSSNQNPVHTYLNPGQYSVSLTVSGFLGTDILTREGYIAVDSLELNIPSANTINNDIFISTAVPQYFEPTEVMMYFRMGGQYEYNPVQLVLTENNYKGSIPSFFVTERGVEFYIYLSDGETTVTDPAMYPEENPHYIQVELNNFIPELTLPSEVYYMFTIPVNLVNPTIADLLIDDYGLYDPNNWRVFRWISLQSEYLEFQDLNTPVYPGVAFWIITREGDSFDIDNGKSVLTSESYTVALDTGWNQIGSPFPFSIYWYSIGNSELLGSSNVVMWNDINQEYEYDQSVLRPWVGYFVYNPPYYEVTELIFVPVESWTELPKVTDEIDFTNGEFILQLELKDSDSKYKDRQNFVGMIEEAEYGFDLTDFIEAPPMYEKLNLTIHEENIRYAGNFQPVNSEGAYWDLTVRNHNGSDKIKLNIHDVNTLPKNFDIWLLNREKQKSIKFNNGAAYLDDSDNNLRIIVGKEEFAERFNEDISLKPLDFVLNQNFPNPFNPSTFITYNLKQLSYVKLEIYDAIGNEIAVLVDENQSSGVYQVEFNGKNLSSGIYIYRIISIDLDKEGSVVFDETKKMILLK